ncbi:serine/threonine-protein kinase HipA [Litorivivens lipolytica]|uniref:Serine/threonine-protein kinase HipA n=1 Tax=Litorivivens lipolytica TaxID=1524264 RepID=A0A7W4W6D8_9GAMM|nr:type II toxin-antitoxin system HipA family toxin [Litorivivens lipolytica]MBB3048180.1 serine/threonine-protein kinase HipA [Litorivivens lipolytica]
MSSKIEALYVWIWLTGQSEPVVAGVIAPAGNVLTFQYGKSYLARKEAEPIFIDELPLSPGVKEPSAPKLMAGCLRDGAPDSWGRRVILSRIYGDRARDMDAGDISELVYLAESGSDRIGRLDFQLSSTEYLPREKTATLDELHAASDLLDRRQPLTQGLAEALQHGTAIGGARPKALIDGDDRKYIAKFSSSTDLYPMVKYEHFAMSLAAACGLRVAPVHLEQSLGRDVLLIERFDRELGKNGSWLRRGMVSALTVLGLDEMEAPYASYADFAQWLRANSDDPKAELKELFSRMVFNILCGNTDDHARNHAVFVDHKEIRLTPAYDICPQVRTGGEASQGMILGRGQRLSKVANTLAVANDFLLSESEALNIVSTQLDIIRSQWEAIAQSSKLSPTDCNTLWQRQLINPFALQDLGLE